MRFSKSFVLLVVLSLALPVAAFGQQTTSDSDFVSILPSHMTMPEDANANFSVAVNADIKTHAAAITLPFTFAGHPQLRIDTTISTGGNVGVDYGTLGNDAVWTVKTTQVNNGTQSILLGFVSFTGSITPASGVLANIYFDLDSSSVKATVNVDTTTLPPSNWLSFVDELGNDYRPQFARDTIEIGAVGISSGGSGVTPFSYDLGENYPNPFNASTKIEFSLAAPGHVTLTVYNVLGQSVKTLMDKKMGADKYSVVWDGKNDQGTTVASGVYFYRLKIDDTFEQTHQMVLLK